jgi:DUF1680 family protein
MQTDFPDGESARLTLTAAAPRPLTLALRRPRWAGEGFTVSVNGEPVRSMPPAGAYVELTRTWRTGDTVSVNLPKALNLEPVPDNPHRVAILWGPLVLAGDLGAEPEHRPDTTEEEPIAPGPDASPVLVAAGRPVTEWIKAGDTPGTFRTTGVGREKDVELVPFYRLHRRTYSAYWDLVTPAEYEARVMARRAERERLEKLQAATVAFVQPGDAEKTFNQAGEDTSIVYVDGRAGRRSRK